jgi:hypothetical protein
MENFALENGMFSSLHSIFNRSCCAFKHSNECNKNKLGNRMESGILKDHLMIFMNGLEMTQLIDNEFVIESSIKIWRDIKERRFSFA